MVVFLIIGGAFGWYFVFYKGQNQTTTLSQNTTTTYVRPPYGAKFIIKATKQSFVVTYSHFDAPGASQNEARSPLFSNQGTQEVKEAQALGDVLCGFQTYYQTQNIFFLGDTNIAYKNQKAFNLPTNFHFLFDDLLTYATSLSQRLNHFANPYDKIIYHTTDLAFKNTHPDLTPVLQPLKKDQKGFIINLFKTLPPNTFANIPGANWIKNNTFDISGRKQAYKNPFEYVRNNISDHLPIGFDLDVTDNLRIGSWNVLHFGLTKQPIDPNNTHYQNTKARNIADLIYYAKFDLIGLLEINANVTQADFAYFLAYLNSKKPHNKNYVGILSPPTQSAIARPRQIERVALVYNDAKLNLATQSPRFYPLTNIVFVWGLQIKLPYKQLLNIYISVN